MMIIFNRNPELAIYQSRLRGLTADYFQGLEIPVKPSDILVLPTFVVDNHNHPGKEGTVLIATLNGYVIGGDFVEFGGTFYKPGFDRKTLLTHMADVLKRIEEGFKKGDEVILPCHMQVEPAINNLTQLSTSEGIVWYNQVISRAGSTYKLEFNRPFDDKPPLRWPDVGFGW